MGKSLNLFGRLSVCALLMTITLMVVSIPSAMAAGTMTITVLDVGQGDATLIQSPSGRTLLFDGGKSGRGEDIIVPFMQAAGIDTLDYMVASHYHADHIGGLDEVYEAIPVREAVYDRGWSYTTQTYAAYASAVASQRQTLTAGQVIDLGEGVTATCVILNGCGLLDAPYDESSLENEYDVGLLIQYGGFDYFQAGDLIGNTDGGGEDIETCAAPLVGDVDVYHVNHHGSYTSSNAYFLQTLAAETSVISVGSNGYGHPHQSVLDRLQTYGVFVYQTEAGAGGTLPSSDLRVVGGHVAIVTDGVGTYTVAGDTWELDEGSVSVGETLPVALQLMGNVPNPFNPSTLIRFNTAQAGPAMVDIYDVSGRRIWQQAFPADAGQNAIRWNACNLDGQTVSGGLYLYTVTAGGQRASSRMLLLK